MAQERVPIDKTITPVHHETKTLAKGIDHRPEGSESSLIDLQHRIGNRAVQRLLVQRSSQVPAELDEETEDRINRERSSGQPLDSQVQGQMEKATGQDLSGVQIHTSEESDTVNHQIGAKAFTTGSDIFFTNGAYQPGSSSGKELLAHELTHVIQQRSGVSGGSDDRMTVNAPHDQYEQEADAVASSIMSSGTAEAVQRQLPEEEKKEEKIQAQEEEEDKLQMNGGKEEDEEGKPG